MALEDIWVTMDALWETTGVEATRLPDTIAPRDVGDPEAAAAREDAADVANVFDTTSALEDDGGAEEAMAGVLEARREPEGSMAAESLAVGVASGGGTTMVTVDVVTTVTISAPFGVGLSVTIAELADTNSLPDVKLADADDVETTAAEVMDVLTVADGRAT